MHAPALHTPNHRRRAGFTLIELLVVMTVMSILAAILLPALGRARRTAKIQATQSLVAQIGVSIEQFHSSRLVYPMSSAISARALPAALGDLLKDRENFLFDSDANGTPDLLVDAWGRPFIYVRRVPEKETTGGTDPAPSGSQLEDENGKIPPLKNPKTFDLFSAGALAGDVVGLSDLTNSSLQTYQSKCLEVSDNVRYTYDGHRLGQSTNKYYGNW